MDLAEYDLLCARPDTPYTGKGTLLAFIDHNISRTPVIEAHDKVGPFHPCFANNITAYTPSRRNKLFPIQAQYHGVTTLSLCVGRDAQGRPLGYAPEAQIHFFDHNIMQEEEKFHKTGRWVSANELIVQLGQVKEECLKGKRYDAVVFFCNHTMSPEAEAKISPLKVSINKAVNDLVAFFKDRGIAVFHPGEVPYKFYQIDCNGERVYENDPETFEPDALALPMKDRWFADYKTGGLKRAIITGACPMVANLAGGFAMMREKNRHLTQEDYYKLLQQNTRLVRFGPDRVLRMPDFARALEKLKIG